MQIVDAHCHVSESWYEPVESLVDQMERNGVAQAVLVQMQGQFANEYLFACAQRFPGRFAPVVIVDTTRDDASEAFERLAAEGASGVRLNATSRSPGADPLWIWRTADRLRLPVSCAGTTAEFASPDFAAVVQAFPNLTIVVEHLGAVNRPDRDATERADRLQAFELARYPNVFMKIPGLGEFCDRASPLTAPNPFAQPEPRLLDLALRAFGAHRLMWGSDYPPVSGREGYRNALHLPLERLRAIPAVTEDDIEHVFGGTAKSVFAVRG